MSRTKAKTKRKQQDVQDGGPAKKVKATAIVALTPAVNEPKSVQTLIPDEDLEITTETLTILAENPGLIKSKACKDLRTAVFDFRKACTTGFNASVDANLTSRISGALADGGYIEARVLLAEMRIREQVPKLGALCRWVRDLDVVSGLAEQIGGGSARTSREEELLKVLDAILRATGPIDFTAEKTDGTGPMAVQKEWNLRGGKDIARTYDSVLDQTIFSCLPDDITSRFRIIETTPGVERKPPNLHPAILYASQDNTISFSATPPDTSYHHHPTVPNLHLIKDVLSREECNQIIGAAEKIGFTPDAPIRAEGEEISILAHNFYWVVDEAFHRGLWARVARFVPAQVNGQKARGLNRRFRVYRYVPGAEYRAHIDGAWPPSGIDPQTDAYIYDNSPPGAKQSSLFTFLIYLNDEFDAGETTFFLPAAREGCMNAYQVKPIQGSVALFPHGETAGSLLHEGTGVRRGGEGRNAKYVIRTDVLYDVGS
ncbi:prolyl 4-hydroxylase-like protein [Coleophoma cylindrospora]|uniref:Prolyl 4-hydroxylase-like protein n=1 Tax=Coleophoma cylindrospora TaxID=1849047 RepID=A0A3D8S6G3_9HELO|nr:prolyl 4-hydroxylase-like protein [Coleophoma cylindrospora]